MQDLQAGGAVGEFTEGERHARGLVHGFVVTVKLVHHVVHLVVEEGGLHDPGATDTPARDGHFFDKE